MDAKRMTMTMAQKIGAYNGAMIQKNAMEMAMTSQRKALSSNPRFGPFSMGED